MSLNPEIIKLAKSLKRSIVEITPHYICGTDYPLGCTFSIIYLDGNIQVPNDLYWFGPTTELTKDEEHVKMQEVWMLHHKGKMDYLRATAHRLETQSPIVTTGDLKDETEINDFMESLNQKAKYGARILDISFTRYFITSCSMIHPVNKTDGISLVCYPYDNISYLAKFIINKKKYTIYEYIRFLYLEEKADEQFRV